MDAVTSSLRCQPGTTVTSHADALQHKITSLAPTAARGSHSAAKKAQRRACLQSSFAPRVSSAGGAPKLSSAEALLGESPLLPLATTLQSSPQPQRTLGVRCSQGGAGVADEQEQGRDSSDSNGLSSVQVPSGRMMVPMMKKGFGAYGGGATLEKSKLDLSSKQTKMSPQLDFGSGGGNSGKGVSFGGGDGGDDGGDDDDYLGDGEDGDDDGDDGFIRRILVGELFDRASVEAVLQEWFRTMKDLPAGMFRAVELGLVSSAQVARFMSIDARPTIARVLSRLAPSEISRAFIGRMMADPAFIFKALVEQAATVAAVTHWEVKQRGKKAKEEWDLILANVLTVAVCNAAVVWCLSPTRSYGTTGRSDWQNALQKLPNHMFDQSYPLREFTMQSRVGSFFYKAAELSLLGSVVGGASGYVSKGIVALRKKGNPDYKPSLPVPSASTSAAAFGAHAGLSGNLRYQMLYGLDRLLQQHFNHIPVAILGTTALRCGNVLLGEPSRLAWLGLDEDALEQQRAESSAYRRPSAEGARRKLPVLQQMKEWVEGLGKTGSRRAGRPRRKAKAVGEAAAEGGAAAGGVVEEAAPVRRPRRKIKQRSMAVA